MISLLCFLVALILLKLAMNISRLWQAKRYFRMYKDWLTKDTRIPIAEERAQVIRLFKEAGIEDGTLPFSEPDGFGYVSQGMASVFDNFPSNRENIEQVLIRMFLEAIGVYRTRALESINPLYWIEFVVFLPREVLKYLGVSAENLLSKIITLVWWVISSAIAFVFALYRPDVEALVKTILGRFLP